MKGQENVTFIYTLLLNRGDCMGLTVYCLCYYFILITGETKYVDYLFCIVKYAICNKVTDFETLIEWIQIYNLNMRYAID